MKKTNTHITIARLSGEDSSEQQSPVKQASPNHIQKMNTEQFKAEVDLNEINDQFD